MDTLSAQPVAGATITILSPGFLARQFYNDQYKRRICPDRNWERSTLLFTHATCNIARAGILIIGKESYDFGTLPMGDKYKNNE